MFGPRKTRLEMILRSGAGAAATLWVTSAPHKIGLLRSCHCCLQAVTGWPLRLPAKLTQRAKIIGIHPNGGDPVAGDGQHVNGADLNDGSGWLDGSEWCLVWSGVPPMHDEGDGQAAGILDDLEYLRAQARERCMQRSRSGGEIGE